MTALGELGLSSYEETVYRTLLVTGAVTATELSNASGVPRGRIYDVLNGLESRGFVRTQSDGPKTYAPVDPETVVDRLLAERGSELTREWRRYRELAEAARADRLPRPPTESSFWPGTLGGDDMRTALSQHVRTATDSVQAVVGPPYENAAWETLQAEFAAFFDGANTDLSVDLLVSHAVLDVLPETFPRLLAERSVDVSVRTVADVGLSFDVIDRTETTVDIPHPIAGDDRLGIVGINDADIVAEFERHFQRLWTGSEPAFE
ncbi:TrmB family transcriptional regulator [Halopiger djelfimassiliensis]|uniref:TrmB family transcriptional regulator n=1 Tax=Halopiger djelfimassiliensis TaxID=1293047 RepID=UPI000677A37C|nr:helix-turn-helix domain-containing protein [Halopiger djelfimassiliensis]